MLEGELTDDKIRPFPALCIEDTSINLPKRDTWLLDNQRRLVVPDWQSACDCLESGLCVGLMPAHMAEPLVSAGKYIFCSWRSRFLIVPAASPGKIILAHRQLTGYWIIWEIPKP